MLYLRRCIDFLFLLLLAATTLSQKHKKIHHKNAYAEITLPRIFDEDTYAEIEFEKLPHSKSVLLHLPLLHTRQDKWYHLTPANAASFTVTVLESANSTRRFRHSSRCHYTAWPMPGEGVSLPGIVTLCNRGAVEGHLPFNDTHLAEVSPTLRHIPPRRSHRTSRTLHRLLLLSLTADQQSQRNYRKWKRLRRSLRSSDVVADALFWRRMDAAVTRHRSRRDVLKPTLSVMPSNFNKSGPFVLELFILADSMLYEQMGKSERRTIEYVQRMVNGVSAIYRQFNLFATVKHLEIHKTTLKNYDFGGTRDIYKKLRLFEDFTKLHRTNYARDCAHILVGSGVKDNNEPIGLAYKGAMCSTKLCFGITLTRQSENLAVTTMAHELGHNFGLDHIPRRSCLLAPRTAARQSVSICPESESWMRKFLNMDLPHCLLVPRPEATVWSNEILDAGVCGNGLVESGEECDCGGRIACSTVGSFGGCCNFTTCRLLPGAKCGGGRCCHSETCKPMPANTVCRGRRNQCDVAEFCNGESAYCPLDAFASNGASCGINRCYNGYCGDRLNICRIVWGSGTELMPLKGTRETECGRLFCKATYNVTSNFERNWPPKLFSRYSVYTSIKSGADYVSLDDKGFEFFGNVPNGAECGRGRMCRGGECVRVETVEKEEEERLTRERNCYGNGILNSGGGHCDCKIGWMPPFCKQPSKRVSVGNNIGNARKISENLIAVCLLFCKLLLLLVLPLSC